ncbi:MAG: hypothetical protein M3R04_04330 [bacterium]|nr:hypothetical protein [bacterium]
MQFLRRQWPIIIAFLTGLTLWLRFYVPTPQSDAAQAGFLLWVRIIVSFAVILGILSVIRYHSTKIRQRKPGFAFSYITLGAFILMAIAGLSPLKWGAFAEGFNRPDGLHSWLYDNMMLPMQSTMFATLAFFIASAAFRAFRARSPEATALLIAAIILMVGRVPLGNLIADSTPIISSVNGNDYHALDFPAWSSWLLNVPNAAAFRGIQLGVFMSQVAISVRIIFGIERTYMGGGD